MMQKISPNISGRIAEMNQQSESIFLQQIEGRISGIQNVQKSPAKAEIGSDFFALFGLQPQSYRHLQRLRCIEMNTINGYNKTKQQTESEFNFHHVKNFVVSPMIHFFNLTWRKSSLQFSNPERASKFT